MITIEHYNEAFNGFDIYDCAVRAKNAYSFILIESKGDRTDLEPNKRLATYFKEYQGKPLLNWQQYTGFRFPKLAISRKPKEQAVMVGMGGGVAVLGGGDNDMEQPIPMTDDSSPILSTVKALATIDGHVYATGGWRSVCYRESANHWMSLRNNLPLPTDDTVFDAGFSGIDGFNAKDIYCAGSYGDVWRFDGQRWWQCPIPTNLLLETVCCAGDGHVYLGAQSGSVIKGRENKWKLIHRGEMGLPFKDIVWYQDRLWCTSDYGVWQVVNDKLIEADLPPAIRVCAGNLSVGDGVLLLAGMYGAAVFDGNRWEILVDPIMANKSE